MRTRIAALLVAALIWPGHCRADYLFTSQPVNGHVVRFWLGLSASAGGGAMQVDLSNPYLPTVSLAGATGEHVLRFGLSIDGQDSWPGRVRIEDSPPGYVDALMPGNPGAYWMLLGGGNAAAEVLLRGTTSLGGQLQAPRGWHTHSWPLAQPGFPSAGYAVFHATGTGVSFALDVTLYEPRWVAGVGYPSYKAAWSAAEEVTPNSPLPNLPEPASLGLFGLGLLLGTPLWLRRGSPRFTPSPA